MQKVIDEMKEQENSSLWRGRLAASELPLRKEGRAENKECSRLSWIGIEDWRSDREEKGESRRKTAYATSHEGHILLRLSSRCSALRNSFIYVDKILFMIEEMYQQFVCRFQFVRAEILYLYTCGQTRVKSQCTNNSSGIFVRVNLSSFSTFNTNTCYSRSRSKMEFRFQKGVKTQTEKSNGKITIKVQNRCKNPIAL
jgi:hypothetical protein